MAFLNIFGAETQNASEFESTAGTFSYSTTTKRTGAASFRCNPTTATGYGVLVKHAATGAMTNFAVANDLYVTFYAWFDTLPSADIMIAAFYDSVFTGDLEVAAVQLNSAGNVRCSGQGSVSATAGTITTGAWNKFRLRLQGGAGTAYVSLNEGAFVSVIGGGGSANRFAIGILEAATADAYFDDVAISDTAYPGSGEVRIMKPNATGNYTAWTDGAGTAPTNVAEVPHDSDTGYITSIVASDVETEAMESAATAGIVGTIAVVKSVGIMRDLTSTATVELRLRSATTDNDTTTVTLGTTYRAYAKLYETDPATAAAWAVTALDSIEVGVDHVAATAARATAFYAMVWTDGVAPPAPKSIAIIPSVVRPLGGPNTFQDPIRLIGRDTIYGPPGKAPAILIDSARKLPRHSFQAKFLQSNSVGLIGRDVIYGPSGKVSAQEIPPAREAPRHYEKQVLSNSALRLVGKDTILGAPGQTLYREIYIAQELSKHYSKDFSYFFNPGVAADPPIVVKLILDFQNRLKHYEKFLANDAARLIYQDIIFGDPGQVPVREIYYSPKPAKHYDKLSSNDSARLIGQDQIYGEPGQAPNREQSKNHPRLRPYSELWSNDSSRLIGQDQIFGEPGQAGNYQIPDAMKLPKHFDKILINLPSWGTRFDPVPFASIPLIFAQDRLRTGDFFISSDLTNFLTDNLPRPVSSIDLINFISRPQTGDVVYLNIVQFLQDNIPPPLRPIQIINFLSRPKPGSPIYRTYNIQLYIPATSSYAEVILHLEKYLATLDVPEYTTDLQFDIYTGTLDTPEYLMTLHYENPNKTLEY